MVVQEPARREPAASALEQEPAAERAGRGWLPGPPGGGARTDGTDTVTAYRRDLSRSLARLAPDRAGRARAGRHHRPACGR
ncbi:hypothetical protein QJS66_06035 [Kocuria rhizophila]|nr:hypothetical protein QJS66_06035 [Kocuria rhizophila]